MNVLLLSMPDSFEHMPPVAIRMPNGALASLAGNIDPHHHVAVADLILVQSSVRASVERMVRDLAPDVVGLSVMTFQRATALKIAALVRALRPSTRVVVGGYDPSLDVDAYTQSPDDRLHRPRRRRAYAVRTAPGARKRPRCLGHRRLVVPDAGRFSAQPGSRRRAPGDERAAPAKPRRARSARLHAARTARRRGRNLARLHLRLQLLLDHRDARPQLPPLSIDRVLADIADARAHGAEAIFLVDDNITLDIERFEKLCTRSSTPASTISITQCRR